VDGPYEFLTYLKKINVAYHRFQKLIWILNGIVISVLVYAIALYIGLPAFASFYWQDFLPLALSPAILSVLIGIIFASFLRRRGRADLFGLFEPQLAEKARTAYDNRDARSFPMQRLAAEVRTSLAGIRPSGILEWRQVKVRMALLIVLGGATAVLAYSQISADITPSDFRSIADLRDKALDLFTDHTAEKKVEVNLSGNIYGKPSLAVLNEEKLQLVLYPGTEAGSRAKSTEATERLFKPSPPGDTSAVPAELYIESLPPQNKEIIKKYFELLSTSTKI
jgi:hypothetical protein